MLIVPQAVRAKISEGCGNQSGRHESFSTKGQICFPRKFFAGIVQERLIYSILIAADIFKVYHDTDGCLGFNKLFGLEPVFVRRNDKRTRERAAELSEKHDPNKGMVTAIILEPCYRKYKEIPVDPSLRKAIGDIDLTMSEAPSMTAAVQIKIDRTFVPVPAAENLFLLYNRYQEERHLRITEKRGDSGHTRDDSPLFAIPEEDFAVYSCCMIVRKDDSGEIVDLEKDDIEKAKNYMVRMEC